MGIFNWIREAIKNPRELSTIFPSSPFLARTIANQLDLTEPRLIAELGPADGALTKPIVDRMVDGTELHLVEIIPSFCEELEDYYEDHPKNSMIKIHNRSAEKLDELREDEDLDKFDYIVSGIPLTTLDDESSERIIRQAYKNLKPGGRYVQFQYSQDYKENIEDVFGPVGLERVWLNILPAWVYIANKDE